MEEPSLTATEHCVHGLAGDDIRPDWPALTFAEVAALLRRYPALGTQRILWHSPRPLSAACLVQTTAGVVFVKRHHASVRAPQTLEEEHRFMAHLRQAGVPVPRVLADGDGRTAVAIGEWVHEVHEQAAGVDLYRDSRSWEPLARCAHARTAGRMLATLHGAAASYRAPQRQTHILVARAELITAADPIAALQAQLPQRPGLADYLRGRAWQRELAELFAPWHAAVQPHLARQSPLWTHNDWHVSNLCWNGPGDTARISAVLDFGLASRTFALFDLATAIERNAIAWLALDTGMQAAHPGIACALIAGYREQRALDAADLHLLAALLPLVHVDFALSEIEYFQAATQAPADADVAYDTFLHGHAAWFATPPGQALLQAIRATA